MVNENNALKNVQPLMTKLEFWDNAQNLPSSEQLLHFEKALVETNIQDVKGGFRSFAAQLLGQQKITMEQYVAVFGGNAITCLTEDDAGEFKDMHSGLSVSELVMAYSRAKYGSIEDIGYIARIVIDSLSQALDSPHSHWSRLFIGAKEKGDNVVLMTTGWRNVPSTANILYDIVVEHINLKLAHLGYPTIINVKLPRIAPPCENYASLTTEERELINLQQDHIIPDRNFYEWSGVHVIFGDDVLVTGSTADKVFFESMRNGAKSFQAIYPVAMDPRLALTDATIEERLNKVVVTGRLDDELANILSHSNYQPILRTLRLVFSKVNCSELQEFIPKVPAKTWLGLYTAALGNEFLKQDECKESLHILRDYLTELQFLSLDGMVSRRFIEKL